MQGKTIEVFAIIDRLEIDNKLLVKYLWLTILFLIQYQAVAQITPNNRPSGEQTPTFDDHTHTEDTLDARFFYLDNPVRKYVFEDTLIRYFHEFDESHLLGETYLNLGYPGSPIRNLIAAPKTHSGFQLGLNRYETYRIDDHNFRFFDIEKALTTAFYTRGQTQNDGIFRGLFARNFKDRVQFAIDFHRYSNLGSYDRQQGRNTNLGAGIWYQSEDQKLQVFATFYANVYDQENNGGITTDTLFDEDLFEERVAIPVALNAAQTRDQHSVYQLKGSYRLSDLDTSATDRGLLAEYVLRFDNRLYRFSDTDPNAEYYGTLLQDDRGMRHFLKDNQIINEFNIAFNGRSDGRKFVLGLKNLIHHIEQEPRTFQLTEWRAQGKLDWTLGDRIQLKSNAEINVNRQTAGYIVNGLLSLDLQKFGMLRGALTINNRPPSLIEQNLWLSQIEIWDNDFKTAFSNHLKVQYELPLIRFKVTAGQVITSNQIFFDTEGFARQDPSVATLNYLKVYKAFRLGRMYNENKVTLQATGNSDVFRIPGWFTEHSLYYQGRIFNNVMDFKTGFDVRLNQGYYGLTYMPHLAQFALDDSFEIPFYPDLDYHLSFQVRYLRFFAMLENILQPLRKDVYIQTSRYPQPDFLFRIGLSWIFVN